MHEISVVRSLLSQVIEAAQPIAAADIRVIRVALGPLTGVEPILVRQAFHNLKNAAGLIACELAIDELNLTAICIDCQSAFEVIDFIFRCPCCGCNSVRITQGDEFRLVSIDVNEETPVIALPDQAASEFAYESGKHE
ncbi:MAG: hydrogenase maturation nickel metallochaperone HypA [Pirellulaceae bacterium]